MNTIKKIRQTIEHYQMLQKADTVVTGLSGGADSCALLSVLMELSGDFDLKIIAAHFNHGLRGRESDDEEKFCRSLARKHRLVFVTGKMQSPSVPKGESPEDYFRKERYRFLDKTAQDYGAEKIALGHHLNDQAETVLLNIIRGSGLDGLKGFLPVRDQCYIRPLIGISKREIEEYLKEKRLDHCRDSSNQDPKYLRNRIRLDLMPHLKEKFNPQIEQGLARMAEIIRRDEECLNGYVNEILNSSRIKKSENRISFSAEYFRRLPEAMQLRLVKSILEYLKPGGQGFCFSHLQMVVDLIGLNATGKQIALPLQILVKKQYDRIIIEQGGEPEKEDFEYSLSIPGEVDLKNKGIIISARKGNKGDIDFNCRNKYFLDLEKIKAPLAVRNRRDGDWFEPLGTSGRQKIKKLFIDHKIPGSEREKIALVADQLSIIWVEKLHLSDRVKIRPETRNVLVLEIKKTV